jgi:Protein of unknown function (DUF3579)
MKAKSTVTHKPKHIITMNEKKRKRIIIQGITESGETFKPSDWAERMSGKLCTFINHRVTYSPLLQPMIMGGCKCVSVDPQLKNYYPDLYSSILKFARSNKLKVSMDGNDLNDEYSKE